MRLSRAIGGRGGELPEHGDVRLLSDEPIRDVRADYFGFATFADALVEIIDNRRTDTPLTVALSAPWGAGKTSVARMMEGLLAERVAERDGDWPRITCWFNAWEHDDAPHLGAALAAEVARTANRHRRWWRIFQPLPGAMLGPQARWRRAFALLVATIVAAAVLTLISGTREFVEHLLDLDKAVFSGFGWLGLLWIAALVWRFMFAAAKDAARFIDEPRSEAARGSMAEVKSQLGQLIAQATRLGRTDRSKGRVVIFVDDLERCPASRAVEVFEVAGQLLAHEGVITVLLADMRSLFDAADFAYGGEGADGEGELGRQYLEKLVQLQLELPPPLADDMTRLLRGDQPNRIGDAEERSAASIPSISWEAVQRWALYTTSLGGTFALTFSLASGLNANSAFSTAATFGAIGATVGGAVAAVVSVVRLRARRQRREVEQKVESALESVEAAATASNAELLEDVAVDEKLESLADKVAEGIRTVRLSEVEDVEEFIQGYPPPFPRGAKRMLNHARLLTKIARERHMFGGDPELTADHLGKWIVLGERWPRLIEHISANRRMIGSERQLIDMGVSFAGGERAIEADLYRLLHEGPQLHGVIERLVYFQPASDRDDPARPDPARQPAAI